MLTLSVGDPEGATPITWSLPAGVDEDGNCTAITTDLNDAEDPPSVTDAQDNCDFKISQSGVLEFKSPPNYESPADSDTDNSYSVVVQATDGDAGATPEDTRGWFKVTINVSDLEEEGSITLRPTGQLQTAPVPDPRLLQPQAGVSITAEDLMDGDGDSGTDARGTSAITTGTITYQWYRTTSRSADGDPISSTTPDSTGTGPTYTPVHLAGSASDIGQYLRVVATYTDGKGGGKTAKAVSLYKTIQEIDGNAAPSFIDGADTTRGVRETKEKGVNIGLPVRATDPEGADDEKLTYWLSEGASDVEGVQDTNNIAGNANNANTLFAIDAATGQLKTKAELDREMEDFYAVTVNVTDSSGANTANIIVTIEVLELDEKPTISGASTIEHVEGTTVLDIDHSNNNLDDITNNVDPDNLPVANAAVYMASDPEGGTITFSLGGGGQGPVQARRP